MIAAAAAVVVVVALAVHVHWFQSSLLLGSYRPSKLYLLVEIPPDNSLPLSLDYQGRSHASTCLLSIVA